MIIVVCYSVTSDVNIKKKQNTFFVSKLLTIFFINNHSLWIDAFYDFFFVYWFTVFLQCLFFLLISVSCYRCFSFCYVQLTDSHLHVSHIERIEKTNKKNIRYTGAFTIYGDSIVHLHRYACQFENILCYSYRNERLIENAFIPWCGL